LELLQHRRDAGINVRSQIDRVIPKMSQTVDVVLTQFQPQLARRTRQNRVIRKISPRNLRPHIRPLHDPIVDFEIAVKAREIGRLPRHQVPVRKTRPLPKQQFRLAPSDAKVDDGVTEIKKDGIDHAEP